MVRYLSNKWKNYKDYVLKCWLNAISNAWEGEKRARENQIQTKEGHGANDGIWNEDGVDSLEKRRKDENLKRKRGKKKNWDCQIIKRGWRKKKDRRGQEKNKNGIRWSWVKETLRGNLQKGIGKGRKIKENWRIKEKGDHPERRRKKKEIRRISTVNWKDPSWTIKSSWIEKDWAR